MVTLPLNLTKFKRKFQFIFFCFPQIDLLKQKSDILYTIGALTDFVIDGKGLEQNRNNKDNKVSKKEKLFAAADKKLGLKPDLPHSNDNEMKENQSE